MLGYLEGIGMQNTYGGGNEGDAEHKKRHAKLDTVNAAEMHYCIIIMLGVTRASGSERHLQTELPLQKLVANLTTLRRPVHWAGAVTLQ